MILLQVLIPMAKKGVGFQNKRRYAVRRRGLEQPGIRCERSWDKWPYGQCECKQRGNTRAMNGLHSLIVPTGYLEACSDDWYVPFSSACLFASFDRLN